MVRHVVVEDLRVQQIERKDGRRSWTIVWPEGMVHKEADRFLREHEGSGTQRTYAYYLVGHLRWLERECLAQRTNIGELTGQIRDLRAEWTEESIQRITTENTTLKQRVRQLTADNRTLDE